MVNVFDKVEETGALPGLHRIARHMARLENGIGRREAVAGRVAHHHVPRAGCAVALHCVDLAGQHTQVFEHVAHAALTNTHTLHADPAPAADLGSERQNLAPLDTRGQGRAFVHAPEHHIEGRAERRRGGQRLFAHGGVRQVMHVGAGHTFGRMPGGVQVDRRVHVRQDVAVDKMRQHLGESTGRVAGETAVEVAPVDRRHTRAVERRRNVDHRQQDQAALDLLGFKRLRQPRDGDLALVFVAMYTAGQQQRGAAAVLENVNRNFDHAPARGVARLRRAQITGLPARLVEVDVATNAAWHRYHPACRFLCRAGRRRKVRCQEAVLRCAHWFVPQGENSG